MKIAVIIILLWIPFHSFAQMSFYEAELGKVASKQENQKFWDLVIRTTMQISVIDNWIRDKEDKKFHFGDMLGIRGGFGVGSWQQLQPEGKKKYNELIELGFSAGGFAGYKNDTWGVFYKYQREWFTSYHMRSPSTYNFICDVNTISVIIKNAYYLEYATGKPVIKSSLSDSDEFSRYTFKYFTNDDTDNYTKEYIGFKVERIEKNNNQDFNTYSFVGGFSF